jgi:branched-chain amino acid transport system ATP-binding protein
MQPQPIIEARKLSKDFGALRAVYEVSLEAYPGQIHSIIGPNGAGKTTLFNLLTGFIRSTQGEIFFKGENVTGLAPHVISMKGLARSFQITSIFPALSVRENIRIAAQSRDKASSSFLMHSNKLKEANDKANAVLEFIGLMEKRNVVSRNLPYGEKRILDIGIALATNPEVLLLDEPVAGLPPGDLHWMMELIQAISKTLTVILIDHNIDLVISISDIITVLNQGSVIAQGRPDEIQKNQEVQEAYLGGY